MAPTDTPGANDACIDVTCNGLDNRSCGYESSASLTLSAGTVEPSIASPSSPVAVISRQPIVSASLSSRYAIRPSRSTPAANSPSNRRIERPPWPSRTRASAERTSSATGSPSTVSVRFAANRGARSAAHDAPSAVETVPSPSVSIDGISWNVGISAMSTT